MTPDAQPDASPPQGPRPAGFWIRAGAFLIDAVLLGVPQSLVWRLPSLGVPFGACLLLAIACSAAYFTLMTALCGGRTVGKMAAGVAVVAADGSPVGVGQAFLRWLCYIPSALPLFLGLAAAAFRRDKRALHDLLAGTRVVFPGKPGRLRRGVVTAFAALPVAAFALGMALRFAEPRLAKVGALADEEATLLALKSLRAGLAAHKADTAGLYPSDPRALVPKYLGAMIPVRVATHLPSEEVEVYSGEVCAGPASRDEEVLSDRLRDTGRWGYVADPAASCHGHIFVDCVHEDSQGMPWHMR